MQESLPNPKVYCTAQKTRYALNIPQVILKIRRVGRWFRFPTFKQNLLSLIGIIIVSLLLTTQADGPRWMPLVTLSILWIMLIYYDESREDTTFNEALEDELETCTSDLQVAYFELDRLTEYQTEFIDIASHELRTPLTLLRGYCEMLLSTVSVQERSDYLPLLEGRHTGVIRLSDLVTDLIDMSRIDQQNLQPCPHLLSLPHLLQQVRQTVDETLQTRNLTLTIDISTELSYLEADEHLLQKAFGHLLTNAIKYTPDGGDITITARSTVVETSGLSQPIVILEFQDTGIGLDHRHQKQIFSKGYRVGDPSLHSSSKIKFKGGGAGLGLAIVQGIVAAHGGQVWVESPGYDEQTCPGSCFYVTLPLKS